jgi:hypothetical protein
MEKQYTATTVRFNAQGEMLEDVRDFPKCRDGLRQAYKFVDGADEWTIWYGTEMVDHAE